MDQENFKIKVFSLSERLFPMVKRMLGNTANAEDAIQEIMMKLWLKRHQIEQHPNIKALVFLTARNYCIDLLRKKKPVLDDSKDHFNFLTSADASGELEWKELKTIIDNILEKLPAQQKEVFLMRDIDGYEFPEIAAAMQIKIEHARVLLSRARKKISDELNYIYSYESGKNE